MTAPRRTSVRKKLLFAIVPLAGLIAGAEVLLRISAVGESPIQSAKLFEEQHGLLRHDEDLFWSLRPNLSAPYVGATVVTNDLGLRSAVVGPKQPGELRILSMGESTTFGYGVENHETYAAVLEDRLRKAQPGRKITVINAGVSAYTSFQSLMYLKLRGLKLRPDIVLFYHEFNDRLPTFLRDSGNNVIGMNLSDMQRYRSRQRKVHRWWLKRSAIYRFICYRAAYRRIKAYQTSDSAQADDKFLLYPMDSPGKLKYPPRVPRDEHVQILRELVATCRDNRIGLVIMHPSYAPSRGHQCVIQQFARDAGVPLFECQDILHPPGVELEKLFVDAIHPSAYGHQLVGEALAKFLLSSQRAQGESRDNPNH